MKDTVIITLSRVRDGNAIDMEVVMDPPLSEQSDAMLNKLDKLLGVTRDQILARYNK